MRAGLRWGSAGASPSQDHERSVNDLAAINPLFIAQGQLREGDTTAARCGYSR